MSYHSTPEEFKKALRTSLSAPSEDIAREIMTMAGNRPDMVEKAITTGTGLVAYDLQAPAKNLYPVNTPLIKSLPRVGGGTGTSSNWKVVSALNGSGYDNTPWVPEGQRAGQMGYTTFPASATYATIGEEDQATFEAISAGRTFEDIQASMTMRLLQKTMLKEEAAVLLGNLSVALGTPTTPTTSSTGSGATLPTATYSVIVVALSMEGMRNSSLANGVATSKTVTGADGKTFVINGGSSQKSAAASQAVTLGGALFASTPAVRSAAGYAWFVGIAGSEKLEQITSINSMTVATALTGAARQAATLITADCSQNATGYDGLLTTALKAGSGAYVAQLATGTSGTGTVLTASGKGSVNEIDAMMQSMWDNNQCSVDVLYVNSQQQRDITTKCLTSGAASLLNYFSDAKSGEYQITAGGVVEFYYNPYLNKKIPIRLHPNLASGTILGFANDLPVQYTSTEVPNVAEIKVRRDYYQIDWPVTTRAQTVGVYAEEVLAVYAPFAMGVINNIAAG